MAGLAVVISAVVAVLIAFPDAASAVNGSSFLS